METTKVKELRKEYGIQDSRNEYTEEQIIELSQRKLYYIRPYGNDETGNIHIEYKQVYGYISEDEPARIFIKDITITGNERCYLPVKKIEHCTEIKKGIYHDEIDDIIYCTTDELQFCLDYEKKHVEKNIQDEIKEMKQELMKLKNADIVFKQI
ncbi:hypothetical protein [Alkaliphilus sp. B6464]|uniref:hypothetical protein n=1 Tax=Alkaliphilus sp. B6464 TaxID=2731219 RepID=UPI001BAC0DDA|nr:hypothetical protein [Alkaliphilus sp. B6464]QUH21837.1 hypothetical protein HYG84_18035 [Alkaliphilus sp. B6464]